MIVALSNAFMGPAENWGEVVYALIYEGNQIAKLKEEK